MAFENLKDTSKINKIKYSKTQKFSIKKLRSRYEQIL